MAHFLKNVLGAKREPIPTVTRIPRESTSSRGGTEWPTWKRGGAAHPADPAEQSDPAFTTSHQQAWLTVKRAIDLLVASLLLVAAAPLLVACALAVGLSSRGPVFFMQERIGAVRQRHGGRYSWRLRSFTMYKFRSMYVGRDDSAHRKLTEAIITGDRDTTETLTTTPGLYKLGQDPRITPVGKILRRFSLDELPQLLNVIKGDMSIVGPRPPLQYEVDHYLPWHMGRFHAKPGITGLWQVMGRSTLTFEEMVRLDIQYAQNQSFLLDVRILLKTFGVVISGKGAG